MKKHAGFTLVELMIVITIIGVLVVALYPNFQGYLARAHDTETRTKMKQFAGALENYMTDKGTWFIPGTQGGGSGAIDYNPDLASISPVQNTYAAGEPSIVGALANEGYIEKTAIPEVKTLDKSRYNLSACTMEAFSVSAKVNYPGTSDSDATAYGCNIPSGYNTALTRGDCLSGQGSGQNCLGQVIGIEQVCSNGAVNYPTCDAPPTGFCWGLVWMSELGFWYDSLSYTYSPGSFLIEEGTQYYHRPSGYTLDCANIGF